ncbi:hypothetical protein ACLOJK_004753 [Asimina triloba]
MELHSFPTHPSQIDIVKRNPGKEEWWTGSAPSGPFIYTPFSKGDPNDSNKQELIWIVGEPVQVLVELANPCGFDLIVDSIYLSVHSGNFDAFPISASLPPNSAKVISLSGIPTKVGPVKIPGCTVHCFGVITEHLFKDVDNLLLGATQGLVLSDPFRTCGSPKHKNVSVPSISVVPPLPLLVSHVVGGDGAAVLYEGEIRDLWISLANAGSVPVEQVHISLSGKNQDSVISVSRQTLESALPLKPGSEVTLQMTIKAWQLNLADTDHAASRNISGNMGRVSKDGSSPMLVIHYAGQLVPPGETQAKDGTLPPGRRLVIPLHVCVLQGLSLVKARVLSMEIPAQVSETLPKPVFADESSIKEGTSSPKESDRLVKIDPYRGSWGLRLLELELSNPTDVVFEISVSLKVESSKCGNSMNSTDNDSSELGFRKARIDREFSARVLIPMEHFKLPILDGSFFTKDAQIDDGLASKNPTAFGKSTKAELNASIKNLISRIKVRWQSGRSSSGELNIKDAIQAALQTSIMDILLPDPLTFGFRLAKNGTESVNIGPPGELSMQISSSGESSAELSYGSDLRSKGSILAHDMTLMEVLVRNNTRDAIKMTLSIACRDVAGKNCVEGYKATVLWGGILTGILLEIPPLQEITHPFSLYFLVPGEYTLLAAAVIDETNDVLRARARADSPDEPIFCRGPPFHVRVIGKNCKLCHAVPVSFSFEDLLFCIMSELRVRLSHSLALEKSADSKEIAQSSNQTD